MIDPYFDPPKRHWDVRGCTLDNFKSSSDSQKQALQAAKSMSPKSEFGLYLFGPSGRGKSHLLVGTARKLKNEGVRVSYVDGKSLWGIIEKAYSSYNPDNALVAGDVIMIDDLDLEHEHFAHSSLLYQFVLDIYDKAKPVLISSNQSPEALSKKIVVPKDRKAVTTSSGGELMTVFGADMEMQQRVLDRLAEMCLFVDFSDGESFRMEMQEEYKRRLNK